MNQEHPSRLEDFRQLREEVGDVSFLVSGKRNGVRYRVISPRRQYKEGRYEPLEELP
jgi:hypothetical protein